VISCTVPDTKFAYRLFGVEQKIFRNALKQATKSGRAKRISFTDFEKWFVDTYKDDLAKKETDNHAD